MFRREGLQVANSVSVALASRSHWRLAGAEERMVMMAFGSNLARIWFESGSISSAQ